MINFLKKRWHLVLGVMIVLAVIFSRNQSTSVNKEKKPSTYKVKKETLKETLTLSGEIDAEEKAVLKFQTSGRLAWVGVKEGDYVKKYQGIASLDQRDVKKTLEKKLLAFSKTRWDFDQTKDDNKDVLTDKIKRVLEKSQFDLTSSILDVELQNLALEYSYLSSPIEGIVTHVSVPYAGVNITPAGAEFEVVNPKTIYLSVTAEQSDVVLLKKGMEGEIIFDAYPDEIFTGVIGYISFSPKTGESGTVYQIKLVLNKRAQGLPLKLAMTGDVEFVLNEKRNVLSVPIQFVKKDSRGDYITRERNGKKEKIYIKRGEEFDSKVEIKNGLNAGDKVYD